MSSEKDTCNATGPLARRGLILWLVLLAAVMAEGLWFWSAHQSEQELREAAQGDDPAAAVHAFHVLANRGIPQGIDQATVAELLRSRHSLVREMAHSTHIVRRAGAEAQAERLLTIADPGEAVRSRFLLVRQRAGRQLDAELRRATGQRGRMQRSDIIEFVKSLTQ